VCLLLFHGRSDLNNTDISTYNDVYIKQKLETIFKDKVKFYFREFWVVCFDVWNNLRDVKH